MEWSECACTEKRRGGKETAGGKSRTEKRREKRRRRARKESKEDNLGGDIHGDDVLHAFKRKHKDRSIATGETGTFSLLPASLRRLPWGAHGRHDDHEEEAPLEPGGADEVSADSAESGEVTEPWLCLKNPSPVPSDPSGAVFTRT